MLIDTEKNENIEKGHKRTPCLTGRKEKRNTEIIIFLRVPKGEFQVPRIQQQNIDHMILECEEEKIAQANKQYQKRKGNLFHMEKHEDEVSAKV